VSSLSPLELLFRGDNYPAIGGELAERIKYDARTIRNQMKDTVLIENIHYIRPFGGRKILYVWERIEEDMCKPVMSAINGMALQ